MRQAVEAVKEQLNDVHHQLEQANETISILSEKLEDVTADVETELRRIIDELTRDVVPGAERVRMSRIAAELTKLVEAI